MSKGEFYLQHLATLAAPGNSPRFILGAGLVGQNEIMSHMCADHRVVLIGTHAWEVVQEALPTVRLSREGHAMIANTEVEPFEHTKHAELIAACQRCAVLRKTEPWKVYQP